MDSPKTLLFAAGLAGTLSFGCVKDRVQHNLATTQVVPVTRAAIVAKIAGTRIWHGYETSTVTTKGLTFNTTTTTRPVNYPIKIISIDSNTIGVNSGYGVFTGGYLDLVYDTIQSTSSVYCFGYNEDNVGQITDYLWYYVNGDSMNYSIYWYSSSDVITYGLSTP